MAAEHLSGNVFVELGLQNLPNERKLEMLRQMNEVVEKRLMLRVIDALPPEVAEELGGSNQLTDEQKMQRIMEHVPQLPDLIAEEVELVKQEMKAASFVDA